MLECPLPPDLVKTDEIPRDQHYKTTTGTAHDYKTPGGPYGNRDPHYKKAPAHYKVDYVAKHHEQVSNYLLNSYNVLSFKLLED